jgi:hypothetical protein
MYHMDAKSEQDLFDAVFNYFPITFRPPPDDPYGITAQDLKDRLRECISSTPDFAPHAFPALLDKLDSTSMNTKVGRTSFLRALLTIESATFFKLLHPVSPNTALGQYRCTQLPCGTH